MQIKCVVVTGPTATGKTRLAVRLARKYNGEIIGADSRQVYRHLNIGTGKDLAEYDDGQYPVKYHLIDNVDPKTEYNVYQYQKDAYHAIRDCCSRSKVPFLVGGSPLYLNAVLDHYTLEGGAPDTDFRESIKHMSDKFLLEMLQRKAPDIYERTDKTQRKRIVRALEIAAQRSSIGKNASSPQIMLNPLIIAPFFSRREIHERIKKRLDKRLEDGMIEEIKTLHASGLTWKRLEYFGLEYRLAALYLQGKLNCNQFYNDLLKKIRRFCKSQEIWFRKMERQGKKIYWLRRGDCQQASRLIAGFLSENLLPQPDFQLNDIRYGPKSN